mgnify:CR=1 FL=1
MKSRFYARIVGLVIGLMAFAHFAVAADLGGATVVVGQLPAGTTFACGNYVAVLPISPYSLVQRALKRGADVAECIARSGAELSAKVRAEPMLCISLRALALTSATALHALRRDDAKGIADAISEMARWEDELDHVFVRPLGQTEDPHLPPKWEMIDSDNR